MHQNTFIFIPPPCDFCQVNISSTSPTNFQVTDLLGKTITAEFEKTATGYLIVMPNQSAGIYFLRNTNTGQVVKFVKE